MTHPLAIIVPVYKPDFLEAALESLAQQTCQDFTAYICDDCSPYGLQAIVQRYAERQAERQAERCSVQHNLHYTRFEENLGSKDLVSQWERCLGQTQGEPWLWIFSDDDVLEPGCVEAFYAARKQSPELQLFHFDVTVIDETGKPTDDPHFLKADFPEMLSAEDFLRGRLSYRYNSFIVEYVFARERFNEAGGFVHYDLAWCSDDATWFKLAQKGGIRTLPGVRVRWRKSSRNITPSRSKAIALRKLGAVNAHLRNCAQWLPNSRMIRFKYFLHALYALFD